MDLVGGPQGSGKSTFFPVADRGYDAFNIDDHRRALNKGARCRMPDAIRQQALHDYESFIERHFLEKSSFSVEVTLAKEITLTQARRARESGFRVHLTYVAAELQDCIDRVATRVESGGHGAPASVIRRTYAASLANLGRALTDFDLVAIYDNSHQAGPEDTDEQARPRLVLEAQGGAITYVATTLPPWLKAALSGSSFGSP